MFYPNWADGLEQHPAFNSQVDFRLSAHAIY
jgi:hypothetical protein